MARITDLKRIERLKQSTMKLVVEKGFGGASAILIAKDAAVTVTQKYDVSNNDLFTFNTGVLGRKDKIEIGDNKGSMVLTFEADIPLPDITITGVDPHAITFG